MAEYSVTAASVTFTGANAASLVAGEAIDAGEIIYLKSDGKAWLATNATLAEAAVIGMAVNSAAAGQPVSYIQAGAVTAQAGIFTSEGTGQLLVLGDTPGKFQPASDLDAANDDFVSVVGWSTGTATMTLFIKNTGAARPAA